MANTLSPEELHRQRLKQQEIGMFRTMEASDQAYVHQKAVAPIDAQTTADPVFKGRSYSSLSKDEKKKAKAVAHKPQLVAQATMDSAYAQHILKAEVSVGDKKITQEDLYNKVRSGDCSQMEKLDALLRNRAATIYMKEHQTLLSGTAEDVVDRLKAMQDPVSAMMNPLMRLGISCIMNSTDSPAEIRDKYRKLDDLLNKEIMIATITKQRDAAPGTAGISNDDWERNFKSQKFMFKTMLTCHLGKMKCVDDSGGRTDWEGSVANAFAHCSRVKITLPADSEGVYNKKRQKKMFDSFHGQAGFYRRMAATHTMSRKKKGSTGEQVEKKFISFRSQYGMDVAVGGLGNNGIPMGPSNAPIKRMIRNDGSCGHIFMHFEEGTKSKHAGMLVGFESDSAGMTNMMGHTHTWKAKGEFASSFGGQRTDEIGAKYGGRDVDLSDCNMGAYTEIMRVADAAMEKFREGRGTAGGLNLEDLTREVCGDLMSATKLETFLQNLYTAAGEQPLIQPQQRIYQLYHAGK
ncbi:MAG: hypothetical protein K6E19_09200 [Lachnospiraceae bacterium]|nr:hypothetical protein [Lachnospiraceae bacterium]